MRLGMENKRQVILAASLFALLAVIAAYEFWPSSPTPRTPPPVANAPAHATAAPRPHTAADSAPAAEKIAGSESNPTLRLDKLALSEGVEYHGSGHNIFSLDLAPAPVIRPIVSPRPSKQAAAAPVVPAVPHPPAIDFRYFGYTVSRDKTYKAFLVHGEDIFAARKGEIVDHRYRVDSISPSSIQLTDLGYNNTQTLPFRGN